MLDGVVRADEKPRLPPTTEGVRAAVAGPVVAGAAAAGAAAAAGEGAVLLRLDLGGMVSGMGTRRGL